MAIWGIKRKSLSCKIWLWKVSNKSIYIHPQRHLESKVMKDKLYYSDWMCVWRRLQLVLASLTKTRVQILVMSVSAYANWGKILNHSYKMKILWLLCELIKYSKKRNNHKLKHRRKKEHTFGKCKLLKMTRVQQERWGRRLC